MIPVKGKRYWIEYDSWQPQLWTCICPGPEYSVLELKVFFGTKRRIVSNHVLIKACE